MEGLIRGDNGTTAFAGVARDRRYPGPQDQLLRPIVMARESGHPAGSRLQHNESLARATRAYWVARSSRAMTIWLMLCRPLRLTREVGVRHLPRKPGRKDRASFPCSYFIVAHATATISHPREQEAVL